MFDFKSLNSFILVYIQSFVFNGLYRLKMYLWFSILSTRGSIKLILVCTCAFVSSEIVILFCLQCLLGLACSLRPCWLYNCLTCIVCFHGPSISSLVHVLNFLYFSDMCKPLERKFIMLSPESEYSGKKLCLFSVSSVKFRVFT